MRFCSREGSMQMQHSIMVLSQFVGMNSLQGREVPKLAGKFEIFLGISECKNLKSLSANNIRRLLQTTNSVTK